jgi:hypothetical protein
MSDRMTKREACEVIRKAYADCRMDRMDVCVFENSLGLEPNRPPDFRTDGQLRMILDAMKRERMIER